jgi:hypothetical protein
VADRLFAPFSKRVGVASIREWEEQHKAFEQGVAARRAQLLEQVRQAQHTHALMDPGRGACERGTKQQ